MSRAMGAGEAKIRFYENVGTTIRGLRKAAQVSQRQLSEAIGASESTLANIESGRSMPSFWTASQIAEALDCTLDDLAPVTIDAPEED